MPRETQPETKNAAPLPPPRVSVVIPNWNTRKFLGMCLGSLERQLFRDFSIVLVDSGSEDDSLEYMAENFPDVRVIALGENRGFAAAVNAGIRSGGSELVVLLNNDTEQDPLWLESLVSAADSYPEAGFFATKMLDFSDRRYLDGAGDSIRPDGLPYRLGHGERDRGQFDRRAYAFGACAGAAMYRRAMLGKVGVFDEDFGSYCEDGDLNFRAQLAGYRCLYVPEAVVYHVGGGATGGKRSRTATRLGSRNSLNVLVKNLPLALVPHLLPFFVAGQVVRLATAAATGVLRAHLTGLKEAVRMFPKMKAKRREIQRCRRLSDGEVLRLVRGAALDSTASVARRVRDLLLRRSSR
ncbi:glycosyltransferase family 2 protein [Rubrobacter indicoceani]|uniref:glycosyltransferase family 2 protein n=1 Tax=Rubrobacter indicoceani TaxID=2051957 RepID=UPI000E5A1A61|nr:glycosyltransferase family 2 protein [Rubrobacter indicoceani]